MTLEIILLVLESVLLIATIKLLWLSIKEGRGRDSLILEVSKATRVLTRHEYFITVMDTMMDAEREVIGCITGRMTVGDDAKRMREVVYSIEKLVQSGVKVKYLMPKFQDRIHVGWLYTKAGAEVYYSSCPQVHDFRYIVVDERLCVLGVPEHMGEKEATRKGYKVPSEGLSHILKDSFLKCLHEAVDFNTFVRETLKQTGANVKTLARELQVPEEDLEKANSALASPRPNSK